jgi:uncharacterized membrane protein YGL010W
MFVEQPGIAGPIASALIYFSYNFTVNQVRENPDVWKIALGIHVASWLAQFYGHGVHERRAPALFDSLGQAFRTAPLFVVLEILFKLGYKGEYYKKVQAHVDEEVKKFRASQQKSK